TATDQAPTRARTGACRAENQQRTRHSPATSNATEKCSHRAPAAHSARTAPATSARSSAAADARLCGTATGTTGQNPAAGRSTPGSVIRQENAHNESIGHYASISTASRSVQTTTNPGCTRQTAIKAHAAPNSVPTGTGRPQRTASGTTPSSGRPGHRHPAPPSAPTDQTARRTGAARPAHGDVPTATAASAQPSRYRRYC